MLVFSACLAGRRVRYDGGHCHTGDVATLVDHGKAHVVCPEVAGGLTTPREPAEIVGGTAEDVLDGRASVRTITGKDVTAAFIKGAERMLDVAKQCDATLVVLKEDSPSCGSTMTYDGTFTGVKRPGNGVTAALLKRHGFVVMSEQQWVRAGKPHTM